MALFWTGGLFAKSSKPLFMISRSLEMLTSWHTCGIHLKEGWHRCQKVVDKRLSVLSIDTISLELPTMSMSEAYFKLPSWRPIIEESCKLYDPCKQLIRTIELSDHYNKDMVLTTAMELKIDEVTRQNGWSTVMTLRRTPLYSELLELIP